MKNGWKRQSMEEKILPDVRKEDKAEEIQTDQAEHIHI